MSVAERLSTRITGAYDKGSVSATMRQRRWELFRRRFPEIGEWRVLDVGGDARSWLMGGLRPKHLTLLNIGGTPPAPEPWMTGVEGDACADLDLGAFDLVFSNSVIEHVGGHWRRGRYAEFIRRSAPRYWVQTPYRYFPIEPHFLVPGLQFLPLAAQARVVAKWPVGNYRELHDSERALGYAMNIELLSRSELATYFPDAELVPERVGPLVKSWIAIHG